MKKLETWKQVLRARFKLILLLLVFSGGRISWSQELPSGSFPMDTTHVRIIFAGDMMGHMPLVNSCLMNDGSYNYLPIFENIVSYTSSADVAVANLELTLAGQPYSGYPQFSSPDAVAEGLKKIGFNVLVTANNHALDRGKAGVERTITVLDSMHMLHTGTFKDSSDMMLHHPLWINIKNMKLAILNYTYGTNGFVLQHPDLINYIDSVKIKHDIEYCQKEKADYIIVVFHWGIEYERYPNIIQRKLAELVRLSGADAIIGAHPHVVQSVERFGNLHNPDGYFPVVFSLGNFVSNQRERYKDGGILFEMNLTKYNTTKLQSCSYLPVWVFKGTVDGKITYRLIPKQKLDESVVRYQISDQEKNKALQFFEDTEEHLNNISMTVLK